MDQSQEDVPREVCSHVIDELPGSEPIGVAISPTNLICSRCGETFAGKSGENSGSLRKSCLLVIAGYIALAALLVFVMNIEHCGL